MISKDFKEFAELLNAHGVEYMVVGGYALMAHGQPRYTGDIDFWINPATLNVARLLTCLQQFGFGSLGLTSSDFAADNTVIQLGFPPARIDLMTHIDGVQFAAAFAQRKIVALDGVELNVLTLTDFVTNKRATGRLKDLADLEALGYSPQA